ncbi:MAG: cellulase family glycosylhydrolase [Acutalibacteraceae bacterium]|nr:cellulase family glycosylhydrolase [Clostridiales bacterium]
MIKGLKRLLSLLSAAVLAASLLAVGASAAPADAADPDAMLHTEGNLLVRADGEAVRLVGMNIPYLSWSDNNVAQVRESLEIALGEWQANAIRLAVVPRYWLGSTGDSYKAIVDEVIEKVTAAGKYVILDNHSFYLPDDDDLEFWKSAAAAYKDHPNVIFELFNEPAMCTWRQYFEGGTLTYQGENDWGQVDNVTIDSCGVPALLDAVRSTGAKNVCILPGINWSFDLSYCTEENFREFAASVAESEAPDNQEAFVEEYVDKYFMDDPDGNGLMYSTHPYPTKPTDWDTYLKDTVLEYPVLVGECGPTEKADGFLRKLSDNDRSYLDTLVAYIDKYEMHITPWAWGAWPYLNQEPSNKLSAYGEYMMDYFEQSRAEKAVTLYTGVDYQGESLTLEPGKYTADALADRGFSLGQLASVSRKEDYYQYTVTLYENSDFSGKSYTFVPRATNVSEAVSGFTPAAVEISRGVAENLLTGHATVTVSGAADGQPAENLLDGRNGTFWKNVTEEPSEILITLDDLYALNGITLAHAAEAAMMSVFNASDYTVSVSTDGEVFTRVVDVTGNTMGLTEYDFEQVPACYIKITITKGSLIDNKTHYLAEVMAYGTKYTGSTEGMKVVIGGADGDAPGGSDASSQTAGGKSASVTVQIVLIAVFGAVVIGTAVASILLFKKKKA